MYLWTVMKSAGRRANHGKVPPTDRGH